MWRRWHWGKVKHSLKLIWINFMTSKHNVIFHEIYVNCCFYLQNSTEQQIKIVNWIAKRSTTYNFFQDFGLHRFIRSFTFFSKKASRKKFKVKFPLDLSWNQTVLLLIVYFMHHRYEKLLILHDVLCSIANWFAATFFKICFTIFQTFFIRTQDSLLRI